MPAGLLWHLDESFHIDPEEAAKVEGEVTFSIDTEYTVRPSFNDLTIESEIELYVLHTVPIDLLPLVPEKFRKSEILIDYLEEAGLLVGSWLTNVRDIIKLLNPNTTSYLKYLGALIGVEFSPEDETSLIKMRKELVHAIDWYKLKGTYQSVQIISLIQQFTTNFYDMYTDDYVHFYMTDWFVGDENENPSGFDSDYYKSPHFGLEVLLNKVYEAGSSASLLGYLWRSSYLNNFYKHVERTRPVHTVPHYMLLLNPKTDELGHVIEVDGEIKTRVLGDWELSTKYFDMQESDDIWNFDDGIHFDQSETGFIKSITKWVLGTGNYPCDLDEPGFDLENPVRWGTIEGEDIIITDEKIIFEFTVPKVIVQSGISELGLYIPGTPDKLVVASCFPRIDKDSRVQLRVSVEVFKKDLLPEEVVSESGES